MKWPQTKPGFIESHDVREVAVAFAEAYAELIADTPDLAGTYGVYVVPERTHFSIYVGKVTP